MTASAISPNTSFTTAQTRLAGTRALARKDLAEWLAGRRAWVIVGATTLFMALAAANGWINATIIANTPGAELPDAPISLVPLDNVMAAVGSQIFVLATIFGTMSLLVAERDRGTLAWVASKPVSAGAIWVAKWLTASLVVAIVAGVVPLAITAGVAGVLYGMPAVGSIVALAFGVAAAIVLFTAVTLAASTLVWNQAAVAAIGFVAFLLPGVVAGILPIDIEPFLPTSILGWSVGLATGADAGFVTPIAWAIGVAALVAFAVWRMERIEM
jgi:ABC-type transport system involved in multi-copper enzyme maturation permease subunit